MPEHSPVPAGQKFRERAEECRRLAESYRDPKARTQMLQLAAECDRKAVQAEEIELQEIKDK